MKMTFEQIQAIGLKKGMNVTFSTNGVNCLKGTVKHVYVKKGMSHKGWHGTQHEVKYHEISFTNVEKDGKPKLYDMLESDFHKMEVVKC